MIDKEPYVLLQYFEVRERIHVVQEVGRIIPDKQVLAYLRPCFYICREFFVGGTVAGPVFKEVCSKVLPYLGVSPTAGYDQIEVK